MDVLRWGMKRGALISQREMCVNRISRQPKFVSIDESLDVGLGCAGRIFTAWPSKLIQMSLQLATDIAGGFNYEVSAGAYLALRRTLLLGGRGSTTVFGFDGTMESRYHFRKRIHAF